MNHSSTGPFRTPSFTLERPCSSTQNAVPPQHGNTSFWLDLADRIIKFLALLVGAAWTWMHYRRSRTYAQKLELEIEGEVFFKEKLYLEVLVNLKNLGASRHALQSQGEWNLTRHIMVEIVESASR